MYVYVHVHVNIYIYINIKCQYIYVHIYSYWNDRVIYVVKHTLYTYSVFLFDNRATFQFAAPFFILRLAQKDFTDRKLNWEVLGGFSFSGSCPLLIQVMMFLQNMVGIPIIPPPFLHQEIYTHTYLHFSSLACSLETKQR